MRYKVVKHLYRSNEKVFENFQVMKEVKKWYSKNTKWVYCREFTYASMDSYRGEIVTRDTLQAAEDYIKDMMRADDLEFGTTDVRIYECRDSKLNKILND